jgi:putative chitinase
MELHFTDLAMLYPQTQKDLLQASVEPLNAAMNHFDISTVQRASCFLAQAGHESGGFRSIVENLNYSSEGLRKTFRKYFPSVDLANAYARKPEKIANRVYANRMGNGPENSGDGWKFRGRGMIQLTGHDNYVLFAQAFKLSLPNAIGYLETREGAAMSAAWFWDAHGLNALADQGLFKKMTIAINGGLNGYDDRMAHFEKARQLLSANPAAVRTAAPKDDGFDAARRAMR